MAFVGHPILADIRKGIRLRPTQTVDKSRPMICADGESCPSVAPRGPPSPQPPPPPISTPPHPPTSSPLCRAPPPPSSVPPPPPPPSAPPPPLNGPAPQKVVAFSGGGGKPDDNQRQKLLAQIRGGVRLRHVQTVDKCGLMLDEEEKQQLMRATTPNGSLDSQGKSPSPSFASSSPSMVSPPAGHVWSPSDCSSASSDHFLCPPSNSSHSPRQYSPSPPGHPPATRHWPEVLTEKQRAEVGQIPKKGDFQFDEQKQIEERQKEVAALVGRGGAQSRIAAFKQLQNGGQQGQQTTTNGFCTLPRAAAQQQKQTTPARGGLQNGTGKATNGVGGAETIGRTGGPQQNGMVGQKWGNGGGGGGPAQAKHGGGQQNGQMGKMTKTATGATPKWQQNGSRPTQQQQNNRSNQGKNGERKGEEKGK